MFVIREIEKVPLYATLPVACKHIGCCRATLYFRATEGHIRMVKAGGRTLVDMSSVLKWLETLPEVKPASYPANKHPARLKKKLESQEKARSKT